MMSMMRLTVMGRLGGDAEVTTLSSGKEKATMSVAIDKSYKKGDEKIERTEWVRITIWDPSDYLKENLAKGAMVYVEAEQRTSKKEEDGKNRYFYNWESYPNNVMVLKNGNGVAKAAAATTDEYDEDLAEDNPDEEPPPSSSTKKPTSKPPAGGKDKKLPF